MAKKVYVVRKGHKPGIYNNWAECQKQTHGFSGAEFKSFKSMDEAKAYMDGGQQETVDALEHEVVKAYVDGSYDHSTKRYAGGAVILHEDSEHCISEAGDDETLATMRNVAGELLGAIRSMEWYADNYKALGTKKLVIYHDYEGIAKWATGAWKANKDGTKAYVQTYNKFAEMFPIEFVKVPAHAGVHYNEVADTLAKKALGLTD